MSLLKRTESRKVIVIQLNGGLGNQLFQYALGRRLSIERQARLRFDLGAVESDPKREYELCHFDITGIPISKPELRRLFWWNRNMATKTFYEAWQSRKVYYCRTIVDERTSTYDANILKVPDTAYLSGYWQSEKYFLPVEAVLRKDLTVKYPLMGHNLTLAAKIMASNSIGIHIRRGDYVSDKIINSVHGVMPMDYYHHAIDLIMKKIISPMFFVFSDDIPWAKENIRIEAPIVFVEHNGKEKDYEDFRLLSLCQHHIIANSSFSWWGAWLGINPEKMVFAPQKWFNDATRNTKDLIPETWIRI